VRSLHGASVIGERLINETVQPPLAGFGRRDDRMAARARVFAGMLVRRRIAAQGLSTALAGAEVDPSGSALDTLLALPALRAFRVVDGGDVRAGFGHRSAYHLRVMGDDGWPALPYEDWKDTYATLHMWTQVVGKIALAQAPPINHAWGVALQVTSRGLSTRTLPYGPRSFTMEFDLIDHRLLVRVSDGMTRALPLSAQPVADFYRAVMNLLREMGLAVSVWPMPVEIPSPIRFEEDTAHHAYDPAQANRFFRILTRIEPVLNDRRAAFVGKCSPVHFFWGSFDLAVTRFSGRPAPPRDGPSFMRDAYSHEVISHGFWPGSGPILEPAFYAYAVPEPPGLKDAAVQPSEAYYHRELSEFILPYEAVRRAADPERAIRSFVDSTYERAATLGGWDRAALERPTIAG
jgi:hypothetical protein